jgi:hypothetical protein
MFGLFKKRKPEAAESTATAVPFPDEVPPVKSRR